MFLETHATHSRSAPSGAPRRGLNRILSTSHAERLNDAPEPDCTSDSLRLRVETPLTGGVLGVVLNAHTVQIGYAALRCADPVRRIDGHQTPWSGPKNF